MSALRWSEHAIAFTCAGETLVGVVARPPGADAGVGVVIVVGGPQYRAGSHRQFVLLSRALAAAGYPTLRFDMRGMGDSDGAARGFEAVSDDIGAAIGALFAMQPALRRVALWGLCDGASAALLYLHDTGDPRVAGVCLVNPWLRSEQSLAQTHVRHYYPRRMLQPSFWHKLLRGGVSMNAWHEWRQKRRAARGASAIGPDFHVRMARGWRRHAGDVLLALSGDDYVAKEFLDRVHASAEWSGVLTAGGVVRRDFAAADHTFSDHRWRGELERCTIEWLGDVARNGR